MMGFSALRGDARARRAMMYGAGVLAGIWLLVSVPCARGEYMEAYVLLQCGCVEKLVPTYILRPGTDLSEEEVNSILQLWNTWKAQGKVSDCFGPPTKGYNCHGYAFNWVGWFEDPSLLLGAEYACFAPHPTGHSDVFRWVVGGDPTPLLGEMGGHSAKPSPSEELPYLAKVGKMCFGWHDHRVYGPHNSIWGEWPPYEPPPQP